MSKLASFLNKQKSRKAPKANDTLESLTNASFVDVTRTTELVEEERKKIISEWAPPEEELEEVEEVLPEPEEPANVPVVDATGQSAAWTGNNPLNIPEPEPEPIPAPVVEEPVSATPGLYIPAHMRSAGQVKVRKPKPQNIEFDNTGEFPSLEKKEKQVANVWTEAVPAAVPEVVVKEVKPVAVDNQAQRAREVRDWIEGHLGMVPKTSAAKTCVIDEAMNKSKYTDRMRPVDLSAY